MDVWRLYGLAVDTSVLEVVNLRSGLVLCLDARGRDAMQRRTGGRGQGKPLRCKRINGDQDAAGCDWIAASSRMREQVFS